MNMGLARMRFYSANVFKMHLPGLHGGQRLRVVDMLIVACLRAELGTTGFRPLQVT